MTYSEKIKASKEIYNALEGLNNEERLKVTYGIGYKGKKNKYEIKCWVDKRGKRYYSIWSHFSGMNVDTLSKTTMKCYTYDMMSQRTNYSFQLYSMELDKDIQEEVLDNPFI